MESTSGAAISKLDKVKEEHVDMDVQVKVEPKEEDDMVEEEERKDRLQLREYPSSTSGNGLQYLLQGNDTMAACRLIQKQLILLLHSQECEMRLRQDRRYYCRIAHCSLIKYVLEHMKYCQQGAYCTTPHCYSSRQIFSHWANCYRYNCVICNPLKRQ